MTTAAEIIRQGNKEKLWDKYCGYLELDINEYMQIQERLLLEEINIIKDSPLGRNFFKRKAPRSIEEFRRDVPLTTYEDFVDFLLEKK